MTTDILKVKNLKTYIDTAYGTAKAVDGVSFTIKAGENVAIVGESGCGKTLTAMSIMGLLPVPGGYLKDGVIEFNSIDLAKLNNAEYSKIRGKEISVIFQEPMTSLNPVFTVGFQISEPLIKHLGLTKEEARREAIALMDAVKLKDPERLFDEYPHSFSGGMIQRIMIAMALATKPRLLIADEPTTALDVTVQDEILKLLKTMSDESQTSVLFISHNLALVYENAQRVLVMYAGQIIESSATQELFRNPLHPYTIELMRSLPDSEKRGKPLNIIHGTVPASTQYSDAGCRFAPRCPKVMSQCADITPIEISKDGHIVSCHLYDKSFMSDTEKSGPLKDDGARDKLEFKESGEKSGKNIIEIKNLKTYFPIKKGLFKKTVGYVKAVDAIDLNIKEGSCFALVGESGSGKSTLGLTLLKLLESTKGEITFNGARIDNLSDKDFNDVRADMQIIFQDPFSSLNPRMTVGQIIEEGLISLKPDLTEDKRKETIDNTLQHVGLRSDMLSRYPHEFSGGQRQRIAIARVLALKPKFIICDEITSALDVSVQAQILNLLKSIQIELGITILFITHDLNVVEYIADTVALMKDGRIVETNTVEEIFNNPQQEYTKTLLEALPKIRL